MVRWLFRFSLLLILGLLVVASGCESRDAELERGYPLRPIKVIVPFAAGGGTDTFARTIQQAIEDANLLDQPLVILNVPGASGTIGSRRVLHARPDGYTLLCLHEAIMTAKYSGKTVYGPEAFEPIAGTGTSPLVICVAETSAFATLSELMLHTKQQPNSIVFAASIGAPSHFVGLMLERTTPGATFRYTQTGGGAKRFAAIKGGHVDVSAFSLAEFSQFQPAGLRALAICSERRHADAGKVPTAIEQGFDCVSENRQYWWAPQGTDVRRIEVIASAIGQAMRHSSVIDRLATMKTDPAFLVGDDLAIDLKRRGERLDAVGQRPTMPLPNVPKIIGSAIAGMLVLMLATSVSTTRSDDLHSGDDSVSDDRLKAGGSKLGTLAMASVLIAIYVASMQFGWIDFRRSTAFFVAALGMILLRSSGESVGKFQIIGLLIFAACLSVAMHAMFTRILVLDLP